MVDREPAPEPTPMRTLQEAEARIVDALQVAFDFGDHDGAHRKMWVIDQMVRILTGDGYEKWIEDFKSGVDGPDSYEWDTGVAP